MTMQKYLEQFQRDGFLLVEDFFQHDLMDDLHLLSIDHFGSDPAFEHDEDFIERSETDVIPWFPQQHAESAFDRIDRDDRLETLTGLVLGGAWRRQYCMVMFSKPGSKGQAWHQDCLPEDPQAFNLNRLVYTRDIDDETGGEVVVVPGSHRQGRLPPGDPSAELAGQRVMRPRKGTLLLLHGHAWHRVLPIGAAARVSINYRAAANGVPESVTDVAVYRNMVYRFSTAEVIEDRTLD